MTDLQLKWLIAVLVGIAIALGYFMLDWTSQTRHEDWTPVFIVYEDLSPIGHIERWGLYTSHGQAGVILGMVLPLGLLVLATCLVIALKLRESR